jgi:hypothetical protein
LTEREDISVTKHGIDTDDSPSTPPRPRTEPGHVEREQAPWLRLTGSGLELAGSALGLGGIGYILDHWLGLDRPICTAVGAVVGFAFGMFRFIQLATSTSRIQLEQERQHAAANERREAHRSEPDSTQVNANQVAEAEHRDGDHHE